ncbi:hypothetical protein RRG08_024965 [Elysia crispata]|uniref:ZP domain-containing protein n=1 Tax=Elysia crispata TaxID=231223 RepID=A0AAE1ASG0_9GAST|nr:hypothetical protein RRG08_024965 [Elysia crispata]
MQLFYLALMVGSLLSWTHADSLSDGDDNDDDDGQDVIPTVTTMQQATPNGNNSAADIGKGNQTLGAETQAPAEEIIAFCPEGWEVFKERCLYFSNSSTTYFQQVDECLKWNAFPTEVLSEEKFDFITEKMPSSDVGFMLALRKQRGYLPVMWFSGKIARGHYTTDEIENLESLYRESCLVMSSDYDQMEPADCHDEYHFICEKAIDCVPGKFGPGCQSECHCLGEPCNTASGDVTCKSGCEAGWIGESCSEAKERPEVRYFCINSPEEHVGNYVDIHIHAHAIKYRSIYAQMANSQDKGPWCPGTKVSSWEDSDEHLTITIIMNDTVANEIRKGKCVGQEVLKNKFEWTLVVQEFEGILMDTDLQVLISCDFNSSETLQRSALSGSSESDAHKFSEKIEQPPENTDVTLEVVDPYTYQVITEAHVGTPVKLLIKFGSQKDSLVTGVRPHHCVATCKCERELKNLLGHEGCPVQGSPVKGFSVDAKSNNTISSNWFPLFTFPGRSAVLFKCGLELCFHSDECEPGCRSSSGKHSRRRRSAPKLWPDYSTDESIDWTSSFIRILPDNPPQEKITDSPPTTKKQQGLFPMMMKKKQPSEATSIEEPSKSYAYLQNLLLPITCGVLLLLLLVFTVVFLTVHFNLRRTVEEMRQEMLLGWRSRDKFPYTNLSRGEEKRVCV